MKARELDDELTDFVQEARCRYGRMSFFRMDNIIGRSLREYGEWAQAEIDFLIGLLDSDSVVVDIGAFIGTHTLAFARRVGGSGQVYSFEPHPEYFRLLQRNVQRNGLGNVTLFNVGLSDGHQDVGFMGLVLGDAQLASNLGGAILRQLQGNGSECRVTVKSLDDFSLEKCDLIKIDAEGMEAKILAGGKTTLGRFRPLVYAECNSAEEGWQVVLTMRSHGYEAFLYNVRAFNPSNFYGSTCNIFGEAREAGLVFVPAEKKIHIQNRTEERGCLVTIASVDDLVVGLLKKPQYKYEVLAKTAAARILGVDFWANEPERTALHAGVAERDTQIATLNQAVAERDQQIKETQAMLSQITSSNSWKITLPFREVRRWFSNPISQVKRYLRWSSRLAKAIYRRKKED